MNNVLIQYKDNFHCTGVYWLPRLQIYICYEQSSDGNHALWDKKVCKMDPRIVFLHAQIICNEANPAGWKKEDTNQGSSHAWGKVRDCIINLSLDPNLTDVGAL